ncbi:Glycosyltransferase [Ignavibacterium album JCM 16511]|uniref:Glycosyltransferase n=1 Tax=Ignavibacterium album (strain DSM 19864 / JCM 16511 / NBRC 101810 / Mat9-16) TaxID=945713 RepID=I0AJ15_IGNAJ|nr:glycosyltransferase [Ignavibacterium album]AFH48972.1 Glycosyltransferase [Ignavibacterium album JCM 16511]
MSEKKKVLITFLGNINYDTRCNNLFDSFTSKGYDVDFIGFDWLTENFASVKGKKTVYKLSKKSLSIFFYLKFYSLLKLKVLSKKFDIIFAEDLYCLPVCIIAGKIKGAKVIYDCRELFGFLAGLKNKKLIQRFWSTIEKLFIRKADLILTTGEMDSEFIRRRYNLHNDLVIRNLPLYKKSDSPVDYYSLLGIDKSKKVLLYQGVVLHGRGLKMIFEFLQTSDDFVLVILGSGEMLSYYKNLSNKMGLDNKVFFIGKIPQEKLLDYTAGAFAGLSLIENVSMSYYYALPNKLFEYIMAEIPVITTDLPQMKKIIEEFEVGFTIPEGKINELINVLSKLSTDKNLYFQLKLNCRKASQTLNWGDEVEKLIIKI